jgi:hypothetical protein
MSEKKVYKAIAEVTSKLAKEGISKARKNEQQGYKFRGIDDVYNALAPFLAEAKLCILPHVEHRECVERINHKGTALFYVTVQVRFSFVSAEDGSEHQVVTYGEAMDSGDKATNKAMSAAYKYAAMQAFCIPTEADNDADAHTHEVKAKPFSDIAAPKHQPVTKDAWDSLSTDEQIWLTDMAESVRMVLNTKGGPAAIATIEEQGLSADHKVALWSRFDSKERSAMKKKEAA